MIKSRRSKKPKVAVILPSRGLAFSETLADVIRELKASGVDWDIYWSHGRKVPDCLNVPTDEALRVKSNTHFWFVDDDMILPKGILKEMLEADKHAIAADYPCSITMGATMFDPDGRAYFCGNGCLLVKRETLESMKKPIWRSDVSWQIIYHNDGLEFVAGSENPDKVYGRHDVMFGIRLYTNGQPLYITKTPCGQRKIDKMADFTTNNGAYTIREWRTFHPNVFYIINAQEKRDNTPISGLVRVMLDDGTIAFTRQEMALKLHKAGKLKQFGHAIFTNWDMTDEKVLRDA